MDLSKLKILQEAITLTVFVPFVMLYMKQPFKLDYLWAAWCVSGRRLFRVPELTALRSPSALLV